MRHTDIAALCANWCGKVGYLHGVLFYIGCLTCIMYCVS